MDCIENIKIIELWMEPRAAIRPVPDSLESGNSKKALIGPIGMWRVCGRVDAGQLILVFDSW